MKKAIALLATLVVLTSTTFAQLAPSISGSAETKWGTNLDDETNGFETDASVTVTIPLAAGEAATEGEGATGVAAITGTTVTLDLNMTTDGNDFRNADDDDTASTWDDDAGSLLGSAILGDISAKIDFANGAYITIGGHSDIETNLVDGPRDFLDVNPDYTEEAGVSLGYAADAYSVEFTIANETEDGGFGRIGQDDALGDDVLTTYTTIIRDEAEQTEETGETDVAANDDGYIIGATAMYTAGDIFTLDFAFGTDTQKVDAEIAMTSVSAKVVSIPMAGVTITLPLDYVTATYDAADFTMTAMEAMPAVDFASGAITAGLSLHYITLNSDIDDFDAYVGTRLSVNAGYTLDAGTFGVTVGSALGETEFVMNDADDFSYDVDADVDMDLTVEATWTAATYNVTLDLGNVLAEELGAIGFDAGFTGVPGVTVALETTLNDNEDKTFILDNFNVDFDSAITGLENTVLTVNFSGMDNNAADGEDAAKGTFYVGAKISL